MPEVDAEQRGIVDLGAVDATVELVVAEPEHLQEHREAQGHHRDRKPANTQGGQPDHHADHGGHERGQDGGDRERDVPFGGQPAEHEGGDTGKCQLRQRDLAGESGDDDLGQGDDRQDEGDDDGAAVAAVGEDEGTERDQ